MIRSGTVFTAHAMLCERTWFDHGQTFVQGGVRTRVSAPHLPWRLPRLGLAAHIEAPIDAIETQHLVQLALHAPDGVPLPFNHRAVIGRAHWLPVPATGEPDSAGASPSAPRVRSPVCVNFANLPLPAAGTYQFILYVDAVELCRAPLTVSTGPDNDP